MLFLVVEWFSLYLKWFKGIDAKHIILKIVIVRFSFESIFKIALDHFNKGWIYDDEGTVEIFRCYDEEYTMRIAYPFVTALLNAGTSIQVKVYNVFFYRLHLIFVPENFLCTSPNTFHFILLYFMPALSKIPFQ